MKRAAARRLEQARASLADSRLLADRGSANAGLLLDLALKQALALIGVQAGRNATGDAPLDTLLGFVPPDHPASALAGRLADPRLRDAARVEELLDALDGDAAPKRTAGESRASGNGADADALVRGGARPGRTAGSGRRPKADRDSSERVSARGARDGDGAAAVDAGRPASTPRRRGAGVNEAEPDANGNPGAVQADGPTAFEVTARKRVEGQDDAATPEAASTGFWALVNRWSLDDETALALLGSGRTLTKRNTRPRFRLRGAEAERLLALQRIDTALSMLGETPDWLRRKRLGGQTAWRMLLSDPANGADRVLHELNRSGLRDALTVS